MRSAENLDPVLSGAGFCRYSRGAQPPLEPKNTMAYLVLARKYRPQTFAEIVGQSHVTRTLANAFSQDRVHHAFLFCGPRGVGKTTAARVLAKALNCEKGPTAEPCGECSACVTITGGSAVDYFEMDGASNRGIDSIRELTDAVRYQPAVLRKKVYVIDEVHMLTTEAFNALLKTLEEPPPHVTFIMATTEPHKVPNTILSRCQRFDFKLVPSSALTAHLTEVFAKEKIEIEPGAVSLLARESGGSVRDALSLADQVISYVGDERIGEAKAADVLGVADRSLTRKLVAALSTGDVQTALVEVDTASARGVDEVQISRAIARHLCDLAVIQKVASAEGLIDASADELAALAAEAKQIESSRLRQMFDRMMRACDDLGESQQPRLILDFALIDLAAQEPVLPLGDLIERLGDLEQSLVGSSRSAKGGSPSGGANRGTGGASAANAVKSSETSTRASAAQAPVQAAPVQAAPAVSEAPMVAAELPPIPAPDSPPPPQPSVPTPAIMPPSPDDDPIVAVSPPKAPIETGQNDMLAAWERIIVALENDRKLALAGLYQNAKVLSLTDERIEVGFPEGLMSAEVAAEADKVAQMTAFLSEQRGREVGFSVRLLSGAEIERSPNAKSIVEAAHETKQAEKGRRETEARAHPITKTVLDTFGAQIKEIKTDV